ncbi:hypothetical protein [Anoxybacteroides tepidamans]|uniref:hypothetical protein n=1 Tax=Anoxybacteroides tepidamans TaxID=265948 RepID=UPI00054EAE9D|nr:hypothetical protein [Anoxybacillus tepidamans]
MAKKRTENNEVLIEKETVEINETPEIQGGGFKVQDETVENDDVKIAKETTEKTIVFQAVRPMTFEEHMEISRRLRHEQKQSGVTIVLLPYSGKVGE